MQTHHHHNSSDARYAARQMQLTMQLSPYLPPPIQPQQNRVKLYSLQDGNNWVIPPESLSILQRIGFSPNANDDELLKRIQSFATQQSEPYCNKAKEAYNITIAGLCLFPIIPISAPLLIASGVKSSSLPQKLIDFLTSINQYLSNDIDILKLSRSKGIKMFSALDGMMFSLSKKPNCSIYIDFPQSLLLQDEQNANENIPMALPVEGNNAARQDIAIEGKDSKYSPKAPIQVV